MLKMPCRKSLIAVHTIGYPSKIAPSIALPLATMVPLSNSQSTMNAFTTSTSPTSNCTNRTDVCE
jgi:hypothetical protein